MTDMLDIWIESFHPEDHIVAIWDALNHLETIKAAGFQLDLSKIYDNKVLNIQVKTLEDAFEVLHTLPIETGPFVQIYSLGKFITDNIDN